MLGCHGTLGSHRILGSPRIPCLGLRATPCEDSVLGLVELGALRPLQALSPSWPAQPPPVAPYSGRGPVGDPGLAGAGWLGFRLDFGLDFDLILI